MFIHLLKGRTLYEGESKHMEDKINLLIDYRKRVINLISNIMITVTLGSSLFRLICIPLELFSSVPVWICIGYAIVGILEVSYIGFKVKNFNESYTEKSYMGIKYILIFSNVLNLLLCFICFPAYSTWGLTIFFVAALAFLQEKKLTIISLVCNFTITAIYLAFNFIKFITSPNIVEELIMLGLVFLVDIVYIILNLYLITDTLAGTGNTIANDSASKLEVTLNNVKQIIPKLNKMSGDLVQITNSNSVHIASIVEASGEMLNAATNICTIVNESHEKIDHVSENATKIAKSIEGVCEQYNHVASNIMNSAMVLEGIKKSGKGVITSTSEVLNVTSKLEVSVSDINNIATAIKAISDETRILALNALIEASRAGEAGKGFSVVASRVQEMAQSTADTVKGIDQIIINIHNAMDIVKDRVGVSINEVTRQNESISNIVEHIEKAITKIKETSSELLKVMERSNQHKQYSTELVEKNNTILDGAQNQADQAKKVANYAKQNKEDIHRLLECVNEMEEAIKVLVSTANNK